MSYQDNQKNRNYSQGRGYGNNQKPTVKHSGAKTTTYYPVSGPNKGVQQHLTTGWRLAKGDLISIRCVTTSKSVLSEKGWFGSIACTLTNTKTGVQAFHWGTMHSTTGKVVIDSLAMVINPKAKNIGKTIKAFA